MAVTYVRVLKYPNLEEWPLLMNVCMLNKVTMVHTEIRLNRNRQAIILSNLLIKLYTST